MNKTKSSLTLEGKYETTFLNFDTFGAMLSKCSEYDLEMGSLMWEALERRDMNYRAVVSGVK